MNENENNTGLNVMGYDEGEGVWFAGRRSPDNQTRLIITLLIDCPQSKERDTE